MKNNLVKYLNSLKVSQKLLAEKTYVSEKTIGNIVSDRQEPKVGLAIRIANFLDLKVKDIWVEAIAIVFFCSIAFYANENIKKINIVINAQYEISGTNSK